jgi:membrane dipeptidase
MNEMIEHARSVASGILKPSAAELEHGLELHRSSIVIDSYGFVPRAAIDAGQLNAAAESGASEAELQDLFEEMLLTRFMNIPAERDEFAQACAAAGVTCVMQNAGEESQALFTLIKRLARFTYVTDHLKGLLSKALQPDDVLSAKTAGSHCICLTCNGVPLAQEWVSVQEELKFVAVFAQFGVRMMHLTYNRRNMLGDGCAEPANGGISDFGRAAIAEMNRRGIIVDVAHSGWRTSLEAAQCSKKPIMASHTACAGLHSHMRGKPDEVFKMIAEHGGVAGICAIPIFLGRSGDITALLDHIDYLVKLIGADHVAIGTDTAHESSLSAPEYAKLTQRRRVHARFESFWPRHSTQDSELWNDPRKRASLAWTNWPLITVGLVQRGYSDTDIQKIIGGNVLRVWKAVQQDAQVCC